MQFIIPVFACLLYADHVYGDQSVLYSTVVSGQTARFDIRLFKTTDTVSAVAISNTDDGTLSTGTSANACQYEENKSGVPVPLVSGTTAFGQVYVDFSVVIDYTTASPTFESTDGTDLGCTFTIVDAAQGHFHFYMRGLASLSGTDATDREYKIETFGTSVTGVFRPGSTTFQGPATTMQTAAPVTAYTFSLTVVDSPAHADQTSMDHGETAQLKFTMNVNPHESKMDLSGARVTNCIVDKVATFNSPAITFIKANGCFDNVDIFDNVFTNVGFSRDGSSNKIGNVKTYIAYSPKFEMSAFTKSPMNVANALYFKCDIEPCLEDTDSTTAGQCGASHCDPSRKKRDAHEGTVMSVIASVNITTKGDRKSCNKCSETTAFQASLGGLATLAAVCFGLMTVSFTGARNAAISRLQKHRTSKNGSFYSKHSETTLSSRSVKGSNITNNVRGMPRKSYT